ncbi:putative Peptidase S1 and S6, chymotrypsin/Hap [uncultured Eubacteriales bacterium]|uniref:Putative Peptidase S1 and S6, chymotrypsin/Hap n=1 Tax=uncultured Eubacteriales bacterium TaxID=172733 RepID=A0A212JET8_9FIRM|nr:putative Peptidase S1 and S6, chymotrypsin/Hap [uncultured Eubacteriales bacterium]
MIKRTLISVFAALLLLMTFPSAAAAVPMDTRTLATTNKPGVVLVQTTWTADVTWYEFSIDDSFTYDLGLELERMVSAGEIGTSDQELYQAMVALMISYMEYYTYPNGNIETEQMSTAAVGTGFIVTPDGYLVTNAHVVHTDEEALTLQFAMTSLENYAVEAADSFMEELRREGYQMSQEEWDGIASAWYRLLAQSMEIKNLQASYQCYIGNVSPGSDVSAKGKGLDLCKIGEPIPGKDIAILKMEGTNLPTVKLGDDTKLKTGDRVYAMGYPALATLSETLNVAQAIQEPTLTQGIISARKEMAGGWSILQTDAAIHGGNSGGPLFNEAGEVIGVNTFGMLDPSSGTQAAGMNFAVPISIAKQFLNEINVQPSESAFTANFKQALTAYNDGDYRAALELLRGINETNPGFPVVQELLAEARQAADANPQPDTIGNPAEAFAPADKAQSDTVLGMPPVVVYAGAAGLAFTAAAALILLTRKRSRAIVVPAQPPSHQIPGTLTAQPAAAAPEENAARCAGCGAALAANAKFCNACGEAVRQAPTNCPGCSAPLAPGSKFCNACGAKIP